MAKAEVFSQIVNVPTADELAENYPHYRPFALGDGKQLFDLLTAPAQHLKARIATEDFGLPAVAGVARDCELLCEVTGSELTPFVKQFIGAVVCVSMQHNGFEKTGTKRAIPHRSFNKGEFYTRGV
jgi:hypothetical protein